MPAHKESAFSFLNEKLWIPSLTVEDDKRVWQSRSPGTESGIRGRGYIAPEVVITCSRAMC